ncbi:hypothetical protein GJ496_002708 [Pomphorhynchus laevis]|nr:hypothetical protein GJ496_002708 [Pomphorhynchus laevis]
MTASSNSMESIRKKLSSMRQEKEDAIDVADKEEQKCKKIEEEVEKLEEEQVDILKKISITENEIVNATSQLNDLKNRLEAENAKAVECETQVTTLQKDLRDTEDEINRLEEKLAQANSLLNEASTVKDEGDRGCKALEQRKIQDSDRRNLLEMQLNDVKYSAQAADDNYADVAKKMEIIDMDLDNSEKLAREAEARLIELEEELLVCSNNMRSLEVSNEKRSKIESVAEEQIKDLRNKLQQAEDRVVAAESKTLELQKTVDRVEDEIALEKEKYKVISEDLEITLVELSGY